MNKVLILLFSLVSSIVPERIETRSSKSSFSTLRETTLSSVETQTILTNQNNTNSSVDLQKKELLKSKVTSLNSTTYAKPS